MGYRFALEMKMNVTFSRSRLVTRSWLAAAVVAVCLVLPPQAPAQIRVVRSATDSFQPAISTKDVERYGAILKMDSGQMDAAKALVESYRADFEAASKEMRDKMRAIRDEAQESRDFSAMEQMGPLMEKFSKKSAEMEKSVLGDIKTLLNEEQTAKWPLVERTRRRERTIDRGTLAGESVDLVRVVDGLELKPEIKQGLAESMEQYQSELDRALIERNKVLDEDASSQQPFNGRLVFDMEDIQKRMKKVKEAGEVVRSVNQKYAKVLEPLVGEEAQSRFQAEVKRQSYPQVYRASRTSKALDAAMKFDDLDARQKESLAALKESYGRDVGTVNDRWAAALKDEENSDGGPMFIGGAQIMLGDQDQSGPVPDARKARRELDKKTMDALEALLTPVQKDKLPKPEQSPDVVTNGAAIQITR
jgi:hypothetical protein